MSCRVMGRNVETDFLVHIEKELAKDGIREIIGEYIPTSRNSVVDSFWKNQGYQDSSEDKNLWSKNL